MPPCILDINTKSGQEAKKVLNLASIRKAIPERAFKKSTITSFLYLLFDIACWFASVCGMSYFSSTELWVTLSLWQRTAVTIVFWNIAGFFMWTMFVIGHDCGHTTFSDCQTVNDVVGLITHGSILIPFFPWQLSHRRHHMYHNHEDKDYSHPWYTPERLARPEEGLARMMHNHDWMRLLFPIYGWHIYLYGMPDGSHYFPFLEQRMWAESSLDDQRKCYLSTAVLLAYLSVFYCFAGSLSAFVYYYGVPYMVYSWWLVTVTYLQHHDHKTLVYTDEDWNFVTAAFETIDRKYGFGIDTLNHHMTDGHVAHHLFFTKIPHYNLPLATAAIQQYLQENNLGFMYKCERTYDFMFKVHRSFVDFGFRAKRAGSVMKIN